MRGVHIKKGIYINESNQYSNRRENRIIIINSIYNPAFRLKASDDNCSLSELKPRIANKLRGYGMEGWVQ